MHTTETDVLIIGAGPAGLSSALFLSQYGVKNVLLERYRWLAHTPRSHITSQRAVEILRDMGLEDEVVQKATPQELMGNQVFCTTLAGAELAPLRTWGVHRGAPPPAHGGPRARDPVAHLPPSADGRGADPPRGRGLARDVGPVQR